MHDIQRVCVVPIPVDNLGDHLEISKAQEWRTPEASISRMLLNLFQIPHQNARVCNIQYPMGKEWAFYTINAAGQETYAYSTDGVMTSLLHLSKNVELLQQRLQEDRQQSFVTRSTQRNQIEVELSKIPDGERLVYLIAKLEFQQHVGQCPAGHLADPQYLQYLYLHRLEAWNQTRTASSLPTWGPQHLAIAESVLRMRRILMQNVQGDTERFDRKSRDLNAEKERSCRQAQACISTVTAAELKVRFESARVQRMARGAKEAFQMKETEIYTTEIKSWPLIVAELLMPALMISQITMHRDLAVNHTNSSLQAGVHWGTTKNYHGNWWEVAPQTVFQAPAASYLFWPINPHRRIPNRRVFQMKDYLEWIFMEKENRIRKQAWRQEQTGSQSQLAPPDDLLQDCDYLTHIQEQWSQMDPSILRAIDGLPSRFGTVVFNREQRQKELDEMGTSLLNELFVEAESHMLIRDEVSTPSKSLTSKESPSATQTADCPICQEILEVDDPNSSTTTTATSPEKVVKLKSCRHCFHDECIKQWFRSKDAQLKCPMCNTMCTTEARSGATKKAMAGQRPQKLGPMPDGVMGYSFDVRLACYFIYIVIPAHDIPDPEYRGQGDAPMVKIPMDVRHAILPFSARLGPLLMIRVINLFYYGHLFRVGQSLTRGVNNVVIWNGVHLRTSMMGQFGFPAPNFESNCWQEINNKGVAMGLDELMLSIPRPDGSLVMLSTRYADSQTLGEVSLPADLLEEMAAQDMLNRLFHPEQPLLFGDQD
ncbi:hypothetical protein EDD21DRAFT_384610 [Dissophora ornata]|nr:hypothetical protein EDD21DRAFT_384610 [Dissophora ornata]